MAIVKKYKNPFIDTLELQLRGQLLISGYQNGPPDFNTMCAFDKVAFYEHSEVAEVLTAARGTRAQKQRFRAAATSCS